MKTFPHDNQASFTPLHDDAIAMPLGDFLDWLQWFNALHRAHKRIVEIREDCPEPGAFSIRLLLGEQEEETEQ